MPKEFSAQQLLTHLDAHLLAMEVSLGASHLENIEYHEQLDAAKALLQQAKQKWQQHPQKMLERTIKGTLSQQFLALANSLFTAEIIDSVRYCQIALLNHRVFADMLASFLEHMSDSLCLSFNESSMLSLLSSNCAEFIKTHFDSLEADIDSLQLTGNIDLEQATQARNELSNSYQQWLSLLRKAGVNEDLIHNYLYCLQYDATPTNASVIAVNYARTGTSIETTPTPHTSIAPEAIPEATACLLSNINPIATGVHEVIDEGTGEIIGSAKPASRMTHYTDPATLDDHHDHSGSCCLANATPPNARTPRPAATMTLDTYEEGLAFNLLRHDSCCTVS